MDIDTLRTIYSDLGALKNYSFACSNSPTLTVQIKAQVKKKVSSITELSIPIRDREITDAFIEFRRCNGLIQSDDAQTSHGSRLLSMGRSCQKMQALIANHAESIKGVNDANH